MDKPLTQISEKYFTGHVKRIVYGPDTADNPNFAPVTIFSIRPVMQNIIQPSVSRAVVGCNSSGIRARTHYNDITRAFPARLRRYLRECIDYAL